MGIKIKNTPFKIRNAKIKGGSISQAVAAGPEPGMGVILRLVGTSQTSASYTYQGVNGDLITSPNLNIGSQPLYVLVLSGSAYAQDDLVTNFFSGEVQMVITNTFITGSTIGDPFTEQLITTPAQTTWTKPAGVTQVLVELWAGGAAGGGSTTNNTGGGGGAGGQYARKLMIYPSAQSNITYLLGDVSPGGTGDGLTGSDTAWDLDINLEPVFVARGGPGGVANNGAGGIAETFNQGADVIYNGGDGDGGFFGGNQAVGGGGGGAAGSGQNAFFSTAGVEYGGNGASQISFTTGGGNGNNGNNYGAGGGGAAKISGPSRSGGAGAQGLIRLIYR